MILYDSRRWTQVLFNVHRSTVIRRIALDVCVVGVYAFAIKEATEFGWIPTVTLSPTLIPLVGILLSFLLAFRTNTAYDRWWEGRKQWGSLVNNARALAVFLDSVLASDDAEQRRKFADDIGNYAFALSGHLRGGVVFDEFEGYSDEVLAGLKAADHVPNALAVRITRRVHRAFRLGQFSGHELRNLKHEIHAFLDVLGACERIKKTPIPFSYNAYLKYLILGYCAALPLGLQAQSAGVSVPVTMVGYAALAGLEMLASDIEDPFGFDENDLPTGDISATIRRNVLEILTGQVSVGEPVEPFPREFRVTN